MRVGLLTGGGDCPGLNAVIRAVVRKGERHYGDELVGFRDGWKGVLEDSTMVLDVERCRGILPRGGTILGTSRTNPYKVEDGVKRTLDTLRKERIDALVAIGGEDTLGVANKLGSEGIGLVGVPKTIDNDLSCTASTAAMPKRVARMRSYAVGVPPRRTWPRIVTRVSKPVRFSISSASVLAMPPSRT